MFKLLASGTMVALEVTGISLSAISNGRTADVVGLLLINLLAFVPTASRLADRLIGTESEPD